MGDVVLSMFLSLDGYIAGPGGEFIPPAWSADIETKWSAGTLEGAARLLYGRNNFLFNRDFWGPAETDPSTPPGMAEQAVVMNALPKTVFSTTLVGDPGWNGVVAGSDLAATVAALKAEAKGPLVLLGGAGIAQSFIAADLVDEYRLLVTPDIFGGGIRLFDGDAPRMPLSLVESSTLDTGAVILRYRRNRG